MKKVRFIYNPFSGEGSILNKIDKIIEIHEEREIIKSYLLEYQK